VPASAVIPALIAYNYVVAVKTLVVQFLVVVKRLFPLFGEDWRYFFPFLFGKGTLLIHLSGNLVLL